METKEVIRKRSLNLRDSLTEEERWRLSRQIQEYVFSLNSFKKAKYIYSYLDFGKEIATKDIIRSCLDMGKTVALPKVLGKEIIFYKYDEYVSLNRSKFGILEPSGLEEIVKEAGFMLVPGLAFDKKMNRIGYGGGFYDQYLEKNKDIIKVALSYSFQIYEEIPSDFRDVPMDLIISPLGIYMENESIKSTVIK